MDLISGPVDQTSSAEAKIALFRSLFRGREDVYPRRFESRTTGRSGYAPACANEWVRGVCEKPLGLSVCTRACVSGSITQSWTPKLSIACLSSPLNA